MKITTRVGEWPTTPHDAVPPHWRDLSAGHEAAHAVIGLISGIPVTRATIDLPAEERARYGVSALVDHAPRPADWPVPLAPCAYADFAAAGYAWELRVGMSAGAWDRCTLDRHLIGDDQIFRAAADAVRLRLAEPAIHEAVLAVARRLAAGHDLTGDDLTAIVTTHGLLPAARTDTKEA